MIETTIDVLLGVYIGGFLVVLGYATHRAEVDRYLTSVQRIAFPFIGATLWPWTLYLLWRHR